MGMRPRVRGQRSDVRRRNEVPLISPHLASRRRSGGVLAIGVPLLKAVYPGSQSRAGAGPLRPELPGGQLVRKARATSPS